MQFEELYVPKMKYLCFDLMFLKLGSHYVLTMFYKYFIHFLLKHKCEHEMCWFKWS